MTAYDKGSLKSDHYVVKKGDTLYSIAWASNSDFIDLAKGNKINKPYVIYPGQILNLKLTSIITSPTKTKAVVGNHSQVVSSKVQTYEKQISIPAITPSKKTAILINKPLEPVKGNSNSLTDSQQAVNNVLYKPTTLLPTKVSQWFWPVRGKLIGRFSANKQGNKGIKIAGNLGDIIKSTADGRVVYAGSALRGYGNLVIIKHSDDFLSAYAHADKILVKEKQFVSVGQALAKMGSTGTDRVMLHFEIRYHGKSVDPLKYLPKQ
ncbi:MAG: peptidoglycan DD-metalloendopeptidase family protein [Shewanella sp.]